MIAYSTKSGRLALGHNSPKGSNIVAWVDVTLVLESLQTDQTRIGEWLNVVGYIVASPPNQDCSRADVQAILIWSTGPLDVQQYENALSSPGRAGSGIA